MCFDRQVITESVTLNVPKFQMWPSELSKFLEWGASMTYNNKYWTISIKIAKAVQGIVLAGVDWILNESFVSTVDKKINKKKNLKVIQYPKSLLVEVNQ